LSGTRVDATVGIGPREGGSLELAVRLDVAIPGIPREQAQTLLEAAHAACPYSDAIRGNVDAELTLI
jgi:organic hydroperoxide reductase OsmC/OhrA